MKIEVENGTPRSLWSTVTISVEGAPSAFVGDLAREAIESAIEAGVQMIVTYPGPTGALTIERATPA